MTMVIEEVNPDCLHGHSVSRAPSPAPPAACVDVCLAKLRIRQQTEQCTVTHGVVGRPRSTVGAVAGEASDVRELEGESCGLRETVQRDGGPVLWTCVEEERASKKIASVANTSRDYDAIKSCAVENRIKHFDTSIFIPDGLHA